MKFALTDASDFPSNAIGFASRKSAPDAQSVFVSELLDEIGPVAIGRNGRNGITVALQRGVEIVREILE